MRVTSTHLCGLPLRQYQYHSHLRTHSRLPGGRPYWLCLGLHLPWTGAWEAQQSAEGEEEDGKWMAMWATREVEQVALACQESLETTRLKQNTSCVSTAQLQECVERKHRVAEVQGHLSSRRQTPNQD